MICCANSANDMAAAACEKNHKPLAAGRSLGAYSHGNGMSNSTTEIEAPDIIGRAARASDSYHAETDDLVGERMVLNMGPSHPATHGKHCSRTSDKPSEPFTVREYTARQVDLRGNRLSREESPRSWRRSPIRLSASPWSSTVNSGLRPTTAA